MDGFQIQSLGLIERTIGWLNRRRRLANDWEEKEARLLGWSSEPLAEVMEFTGHGLADLRIEVSEPDAAIFADVSKVEADGGVRYVTEGSLRALHRKESPAPDTYRTTWPFRSFRRKDSAPLVPGRVERIRIPLLPVSWTHPIGRYGPVRRQMM
jgi:predicted acyl esterase